MGGWLTGIIVNPLSDQRSTLARCCLATVPPSCDHYNARWEVLQIRYAFPGIAAAVISHAGYPRGNAIECP